MARSSPPPVLPGPLRRIAHSRREVSGLGPTRRHLTPTKSDCEQRMLTDVRERTRLYYDGSLLSLRTVGLSLSLIRRNEQTCVSSIPRGPFSTKVRPPSPPPPPPTPRRSFLSHRLRRRYVAAAKLASSGYPRASPSLSSLVLHATLLHQTARLEQLVIVRTVRPHFLGSRDVSGRLSHLFRIRSKGRIKMTSKKEKDKKKT